MEPIIKIKKGQLSNVLRQFGLIYFTDHIRYFLERNRNKSINRDFRQNNPEVKLPPDYLMYESFQVNYKKYYTNGAETARWIAGHLRRHTELRNQKILDWGCGPGRVIRHLPLVIGHGCTYYGTDYNARSIAWCTENLPGIQFNCNTLEAKLPYPDNFFNAIYGISIFTHLSEPLHHSWYHELMRILKPGGILFLTTQGENFRVKLTSSELSEFDMGKLVIRGKVKEGHRTYSAFHPAAFMKKLFAEAAILEHIETRPEPGKGLPQDVWIIRKR